MSPTNDREPHVAVAGSTGAGGPLALDLARVTVRLPVREGGIVRRRTRETVALEDVDLRVHRGSVVGVIAGPGCGKTLLARAATGGVALTAGTVSVDGRDLAGARGKALAELGQQVQTVAADPWPALPRRQPADAILASLSADTSSPAHASPSAEASLSADASPSAAASAVGSVDARAAALALLSSVGITSDRPVRTRDLTSTQRCVLALARTVGHAVPLVIADGLSQAVDREVLPDLLEVLALMREERETAVLVLDREPSVLGDWCDVTAVMHAGRIVELAGPVDLRLAPLHPLTRNLLREVPTKPIQGAWRVPPPRQPGDRLPVDGAAPGAGCGYRSQCLRAQDRCAREVPALERPLGETHAVACHFPEQRRTIDLGRLRVGGRDALMPGSAEPTAREFAQG